jgi:hypothetical protein
MQLPEKPTNTRILLEGGVRTQAKKFINKASCQRYLLDYADQTRHHKFMRVHPEVFHELEVVVRKHMRAIVSRNIDFGRTIK